MAEFIFSYRVRLAAVLIFMLISWGCESPALTEEQLQIQRETEEQVVENWWKNQLPPGSTNIKLLNRNWVTFTWEDRNYLYKFQVDYYLNRADGAYAHAIMVELK